jgi:hypothetical protein
MSQHRLSYENGVEDGFQRGWNEALDQCLYEIQLDCHHTKYVGCRPCVHDQMQRLLETLQLKSANADS